MLAIGGIGRSSREKLARLLRQSKGTVTPEDAARILNLPRVSAAQLLARWAASGWLLRVRRGIYVPVPLESTTTNIALEDAWVIASRLFTPCYIGGWSAAEHWGLTEQWFRSTLVITTRRPRSRRIETQGTVFVLRTVRPKALFGLKAVWRGQTKINVSDVSRTIVDILDEPAIGGGIRSVLDMLKAYLALEFRDPKLLIQYAEQLGNKAVFKRLGYLASSFLQNESELVSECRLRLSAGNAKLDPKLPSDRLVTAWRLWVPAALAPGDRA